MPLLVYEVVPITSTPAKVAVTPPPVVQFASISTVSVCSFGAPGWNLVPGDPISIRLVTVPVPSPSTAPLPTASNSDGDAGLVSIRRKAPTNRVGPSQVAGIVTSTAAT